MSRLAQSINAFCLMTVTIMGIVMHLAVGYSGFVNPLHHNQGLSISSASSVAPETNETNTKTAKLKRKIAVELFVYAHCVFQNTDFSLISVHTDRIQTLDLNFHDFKAGQNLRPPMHA